VLLPADEQGRVRIPDALIEHAGLKDKVAFLGLSQKFQIWDAERLAAVEQERLTRIREKFERERTRQSGEGMS
jgi:MraZ protein